MKVTLLGPQRRPTLEGVAASLYPDGPVATVTAGWQEREGDDAELSRLLGARDVNLRLYQRWLDVQERDPVFAAGERRLAELLGELQDLYLLRLDHALQAATGSGRVSWLRPSKPYGNSTPRTCAGRAPCAASSTSASHRTPGR